MKIKFIDKFSKCRSLLSSALKKDEREFTKKVVMKNLKVLFFLLCFLYDFSVKAEENSTVAKTPLPAIQPEEPDNVETFQEIRNNATDHTSTLTFDSSTASENWTSKRFLEVGLEYPTSFGVNLRYLLTDSVYARFGLGFMSEFLLNSFEKIADSFGYLNQEEAKLLSDTLKNSLYLDFRLAWAPYLKAEGGGPYLELGLSHSRSGKGGSRGITLNQVLEDDSFDETKRYSLRANTYNFNFHVGYQIPIEKVRLNFEIGLIKILRTELLGETSIDYPENLSGSQKNRFQDFLETKGWVFPTFSGWIGFAF